MNRNIRFSKRRFRIQLRKHHAGWEWGYYIGRGVSSMIRGGISNNLFHAIKRLVLTYSISRRQYYNELNQNP
jgi:hypothetical protein